VDARAASRSTSAIWIDMLGDNSRDIFPLPSRTIY
jgi:hypothetical protein